MATTRKPKLTTPEFEIDGDMLVIKLPINPNPTPSKSGKTLVISTTGGNLKPQGLEIDGAQVSIGVNAYIPNPDRE